MHLSPLDMFRSQTNLYSTFDEEGMPILDHAGKYPHVHVLASVAFFFILLLFLFSFSFDSYFL